MICLALCQIIFTVATDRIYMSERLCNGEGEREDTQGTCCGLPSINETTGVKITPRYVYFFFPRTLWCNYVGGAILYNPVEQISAQELTAGGYRNRKDDGITHLHGYKTPVKIPCIGSGLA